MMAEEVTKATALEEAKELYEKERAEYNKFPSDFNREYYRDALDKWEKLALEVVAKATTVKEAMKVYERPWQIITDAVIEKLVEFCNTLEKAREASMSISDDENAVKETLLDKWNKISLLEVNKATTLEELKKAYERAPRQQRWCSAKSDAFWRWNELSLEEVAKATTLKELKRAYERAPISEGSKAKRVAIKRIFKIYFSCGK